MTKTHVLLAGALLASCIPEAVASPKVLSLSFQKRAVRNAGPSNMLRKRQKSVTATLHNEQYLYLINATAGDPPQQFSLHIDTGSSDIWLPYAQSDVCSQQPERCTNGVFSPSDSSRFTDLTEGGSMPNFDISYVDGTQILGDYVTDNFGVGGATVTNMTMGIATQMTLTDDVSSVQGIMGVGFQAGESIASQYPDLIYPNIITQLKSQGHIRSRAYSLWLNDLESNTGNILFGGVDTEKYEGDLVVLPVQEDTASGSLSSFTVVLDNMFFTGGNGEVQYNKSNLDMAVILDSGTTLTYMPDDIADEIAGGVGAFNDPQAGMVLPCSVGQSAATLSFGFGNPGGPKIKVELSQFVLPFPQQPDNQPVTFRDGTVACQWGILGSGQNPNLFGDTFLRSAYVVYDIDNHQVGIAQTTFNSTNADIQEIDSAIPGASSTASGHSVTQTFSGYPKPSGTQQAPNSGQLTALPTATFDLGSSSGSGNSRPSDTGAANAVSVPPFAISTLFTGLVVALSMMGGSLLIFV
ncbi:acid protease [Aulographum hederae CBS 113979]|uniref:Acid protease n=1 Tax=Aulographum hederae CBS 113979 TaxID=1176131 RepID=A0A6G1H7S9_9PEZI|nr:acid protease [Aulographum hederae CBS 113979]